MNHSEWNTGSLVHNSSRIINLNKLHEHLQVISQCAATCQLCAVSAISGKEAALFLLVSRIVKASAPFWLLAVLGAIRNSNSLHHEEFRYKWWPLLGVCLSKKAFMSTEKRIRQCMVVGSSQGINETIWGGREGHCHLQRTLPPRYTSHYCDCGQSVSRKFRSIKVFKNFVATFWKHFGSIWKLVWSTTSSSVSLHWICRNCRWSNAKTYSFTRVQVWISQTKKFRDKVNCGYDQSWKAMGHSKS